MMDVLIEVFDRSTCCRFCDLVDRKNCSRVLVCERMFGIEVRVRERRFGDCEAHFRRVRTCRTLIDMGASMVRERQAVKCLWRVRGTRKCGRDVLRRLLRSSSCQRKGSLPM